MSDVISVIERDHEEIKRPTPATLTLYFYDAELGAPEVDPGSGCLSRFGRAPPRSSSLG
jgi:hypothetical protein